MKRAALFIVCSLLFGCDRPELDIDPPLDAGTAPVDAGAAPLLASDYCETIVDFFCPYYLRCGRMDVSDLESCRAVFLETCNERYEPRYVALAELGLLSLDRAGVQACQAHLESVDCPAQIRDLDGPCGQMWVGTAPEGASCSYDLESLVCAPGTECVVGLDLCGECRAVAAPGDSCAELPCGVGATCIDDICVARGLHGDRCDDDTPCTIGASCEAGVCAGPTFVRPPQACDRQRRCAYKSVCSDGQCRPTALLGEPCEPAVGCASGRCVGGVCAPLGRLGDACEFALDCQSATCVDNVCVASTGRCAGT